MRIDWVDLRIFLHVCEAGSMTGAAERSHLTLAAVSARIRNLEECNGLVLLRRQPRGVAPTAAGEVLASHARRIFEQVRQLERDLQFAREQGELPLVLLANTSALAQWKPQAIVECDSSGRRPIVIRESCSEASVQALRCGAADAAIVSDAVDTRGLVTRKLAPDPLALVVSRAHPLAARSTVRFEQALAEPWVTWGEQSAISTHIQMRAFALGARIERRVSHPTLAGVLRFVSAGVGVSVLPRKIVEQAVGSGELACVPLEESWAQRYLLVCYPDDAAASRSHLADTVARGWPTGA